MCEQTRATSLWRKLHSVKEDNSTRFYISSCTTNVPRRPMTYREAIAFQTSKEDMCRKT